MSRSLSWPVRLILLVATVLSVAGIHAVWANRQLLDTGYWTRTNTKLLENHAIQRQLSTYLTDQLYANVDLAGELRSGLPKDLRPLAGPAAGGLRTVVEEGVLVALQSAQVQQLWRKASEATHEQLVDVIESKGTVVRTKDGGAVVLDLRPLVANLADRFGTPASVVERLRRSVVGEVTILRAKRLETLQGAARGLHDLAIVLPALVLLLLALAVGLSPGRRSRALVAAGLVGVVSGVIALIVRSIVGAQVVGEVIGSESVRPAADAAWSIATSVLVEVAVGTILIGALVSIAGLVAGRSRWSSSLRRVLAPYLRDRPDVAFGATGVVLVLFFLWGPIQATHRLLGIVLISVLTLLGVELLRRQTRSEFPTVHYLPERDGLRGRTIGARDLLVREGSRLRAGVGATEQGTRATTAVAVPPASSVEQLERLAALHAGGELTDEEFSAAKRRLLSD
jgi:Short C-terminal domain